MGNLIKEEVVIGDCRLLLGDCLEILPTLEKVDCVVTDPPYGIDWPCDNRRFSGGSEQSKRSRPKKPKTYTSNILGDDRPFDPTPFLIGEKQIFWGWNHFSDRLPKGAALIWLKRNEDALGAFLSDAELAWFSSGHGVYGFKDLSNAGIATERVHPTQKPVSLMEWCIKKTSGTVLDPFLGSGTTLVACAKLGRRGIGIEMDKGYFDIAVERVRKAYDQPDLFVAHVAKPQQVALGI